jgi:glycogen synthase
MRILVISNLYPPHFLGGYELGCRDVVEGLVARGYEVKVLTSTYGVSSPRRGRDVDRSLRLYVPGRRRWPIESVRTLRREVVNRRLVSRACRDHRPDVVYVWNLGFLEPSVATAAEALGYPVCYFVSDHWLARVADGRRPLIFRRPLQLRHVQFASEHLKTAAVDAGLPVEDAEVIHWGVDVRRHPFTAERRDPTRLIYVGRLVAQKGFHTALAALRIIIDQSPEHAPSLTIVGAPESHDRAWQQVEQLGLDRHVRFTGLIPREELWPLYDSHEILLFPSVWPEPFSITLLEAMASGLAVVTTITGGTGEVAEDGVNCLAFAPHDAAGCAANVLRLMGDRALARQLRINARRRIEESFLLDAMVERIDRSLRGAARQAGRTGAAP